MNRSQFVFVLFINVLVTVLITSSILLLYEWRRPQPNPEWWLGTDRAQMGAPAIPPAATPVAGATPATASANATPAADSTQAGNPAERTYTVREGDSLSAIAALFGISQSALAAANGITNHNLVTVGQTLTIPAGGTADVLVPRPPTAEDLGLEVLNAGNYAEEVVVIVNQGQGVIDLSGWSIHTSLEEEYTFVRMSPLYQGESVRLMSGAGTDTAYDRNWGRLPTTWTPGTIIALRDPSGAEILRVEIP